MKLYYHPRSPYSQKVLLALREKGIAITSVIINPLEDRAKLLEVNPLGKVPVLVLDDGWKIPESTIIVEYLDAHHGGARLIPEDRDRARQTRFHDRIADLYVNEPMQTVFWDGRKPEAEREPARVAAARARLDAVFAGLDQHLARRDWIMGDDFTMADCALLPPLGYCRMLHPFERWKHLSAYAARGFERASWRAVMEELAPYLAA
jgi:glutathione S-transferase